MKLHLGGRRKYWVFMGAMAAATLILLFAWAIPAHSRAVEAENGWAAEVKELGLLRTAVEGKKVPSVAALEGVEHYQDWLKEQDKVVREFFADRASVLEAPLTGQGAPNPVDFKEDYMQAVTTQDAWLGGRLVFSDVSRAFPSYSWTTGTGLPKPEDYAPALRGYWARVILYHILLDPAIGVRAVRKFELGPAAPLTPEFDAMPFQIDLTLSAGSVTQLLQALLTVSPSNAARPVINLTRMSLGLEPVGNEALCGMQLNGNILMLNRNLWGKSGGGSGK